MGVAVAPPGRATQYEAEKYLSWEERGPLWSVSIVVVVVVNGGCSSAASSPLLHGSGVLEDDQGPRRWNPYRAVCMY